MNPGSQSNTNGNQPSSETPEPEKDETPTWVGVQSHWFQMKKKRRRKVIVQLLSLAAAAVSGPGEGTRRALSLWTLHTVPAQLLSSAPVIIQSQIAAPLPLHPAASSA